MFATARRKLLFYLVGLEAGNTSQALVSSSNIKHWSTPPRIYEKRKACSRNDYRWNVLEEAALFAAGHVSKQADSGGLQRGPRGWRMDFEMAANTMVLMNWSSPIARSLFLLIPLFQSAPAVESLWLLGQLPIMDQLVYRTETFQENATKQFIILDASAESFDSYFGISCTPLLCSVPEFVFNLILRVQVEMYWSVCSWGGQSIGETSDDFCPSNQNLRKEWNLSLWTWREWGFWEAGGVTRGASGSFFHFIHFHWLTRQKQQQVQLPHFFFLKREDTTSPPRWSLKKNNALTVNYSLQAACTPPPSPFVYLLPKCGHEISQYACA